MRKGTKQGKEEDREEKESKVRDSGESPGKAQTQWGAHPRT